MAWELTVSDKLSSWGYGGKIYKPGIYIVTRGDTAEAAREAQYVSVREVDDADAALLAQFGEDDAPTGILTREEMFAKVGTDFVCTVAGCESPPYKTKKAMSKHIETSHSDEEKEEAAAAADAPPEELVAVEDVGELVEEPA